MLRNSCYLRMSSPVLAQKDQFPWLLIMSSPVISSDKKITVPSWPGSPHLNRKLDHLKVTRLPSVHPTYLAGKSHIYREYSHSYLYLWGNFHCNVWLPESVYIYIPRGLGFSDGEAVGWGGVGWGMLPSCSCYVDATLMGGVGWGRACYRHVHVTLMLRWWEGWGGACYRHVHVTLMLRCWEGWGGSRCSAVSVGSLQKHRCFWPSGSIAGLPRSSVGKVKKTFHRCCVRAAD